MAYDIKTIYRQRMSEMRCLWNLYKCDPHRVDLEHSRYGFWSLFVKIGLSGIEEFRFYTSKNLNLLQVSFYITDWRTKVSYDVPKRDMKFWREVWKHWKRIGKVKLQKSLEKVTETS